MVSDAIRNAIADLSMAFYCNNLILFVVRAQQVSGVLRRAVTFRAVTVAALIDLIRNTWLFVSGAAIMR